LFDVVGENYTAHTFQNKIGGKNFWPHILQILRKILKILGKSGNDSAKPSHHSQH
jgi:hypothetical protein